MAANSFFLGGTDLADVILARVDERDAIATYPQLIEEVRARCGSDVASLFAEPIRGTNRATGIQNIAWYCSFEGSPFSLGQLDAAGRRPIVELLTARLNAFATLFGDSRSGAVFASWLNMLSPESIMAVAGQPVIRNWGMLPLSVAASADGRETHFRNTLGLYLPKLPVPPFHAIDAPAFADQISQVAERETARAARRDPPEPAPPASAMPNPAMQAPAEPIVAMPSPSVMLALPAERAWRAPVIACGIAALVLLVLLFGRVLRYPDAPAGPDSAAIEAQRETNQALRDRLDRLHHAASDTCRAEPGMSRQPGAPDTPPLLPPSPSQTKIITDPTGSRPEKSTLGAVLEKATVLVLLNHSLGSGFFISDRYIVTNHHVVGNDTEARVANKALGGIVAAKVVAVGAGAERGTQDIAVLEIEPKAGIAMLPLGITPDRLEQVTASGYPGAVLETIEHDQSSLPEANFTQGIVTSHQVQQPAGITTIIHTAQIGHGNSGGPLVDAGGCAVGINSWLATDEMDRMIFSTYFQALDASELRRFLTSKNIAFTASDVACKPVAPTPAIPATPAAPAAPGSPPAQPPRP